MGRLAQEGYLEWKLLLFIVPEAQQTCGRLSENLPKWARDMVLCKQQRLSYNYKEKGFYFMAKSAKLFLSDFIYTVLGMAKTVIK